MSISKNQASGAKAPYGMVGVLADKPIEISAQDATEKTMFEATRWQMAIYISQKNHQANG